MAERRGHPLVAAFIAVVTVCLTLMVFAISSFNKEFSCSGSANPNCDATWVTLLVVGGLLFLGGLWCAWRIGAGRSSAGRRPAADAPAEPGRTWRVSDPGDKLREAPSGTKVAWLAGGTAVVEVERQGDFIKVTAPDSRTGWVGRRSVF
jgi:hypothetical protein